MATPISSASPMTWGTPPDPNQTLQRIEQNTANILWWVKVVAILVGATLILVLIAL
jgi:hypothetical protein